MLSVELTINEDGMSTVLTADDLDDIAYPRQKMRAILHDIAEAAYNAWVANMDDSHEELEFSNHCCNKCGHPLTINRYGNGDFDRFECINCKYNDKP